MALPEQTLRIIDANLNRAGEGLRVLEDLARLLLNDALMTEKLKTMRHQLVVNEWPLNQRLLQARNSGSDVGADMEIAGQKSQEDVPALVVANARRVQEALRVIEEMAKIPGTSLNSNKFKEARFDLYTIERELVSRVLRRDKAKLIAGLYVIIDTGSLKALSPIEAARQVILGGAAVVQLRDKTLPDGELLLLAREIRHLCGEHKVLFILNGHPDIALAAGADGVHLEKDDLPVEEARRLLAIDMIVGATVLNAQQATAAQSDGADYFAVDADRLEQVSQIKSLPVVAICGVIVYNAAKLLVAGAAAVAVDVSVWPAEGAQADVRKFTQKLKRK